MNKRCTKCGDEKPTTEFHRDSRAKDGLQAQCKDCKAEYWRQHGPQYRATHKEEQSEYDKQWREADLERYIDKDRHTTIKCRRIHPNATQVPFKRLDLYVRDLGHCQAEECLCPDGRAIHKLDWDNANPWGFEVDHIVPLKWRGWDTIENCQSTHRRCNVGRNKLKLVVQRFRV